MLDLDRHVTEPMDMWPEYLPARLRDLAPRLVPGGRPGEPIRERLERLGEHALLPIPPVVHVGDRPLLRDMPEVAHIETSLQAQARMATMVASMTPSGQLRAMDHEGTDRGVLFPYIAAFLVYDDRITAAHSRAYAHAYNRWLADYCAHAPRRLVGAALLSRHDPQAMVADLEQALRDGFGAVTVRPNPVQGKTLSAPAYSRFWAACEHAEVPVLIHEATPAHVATAGDDRFDTLFARHACSHPMEAMMALLSLIDGGVLEAHPRLRVAFFEAGAGWVPHWLWRLDEIEYAALAGEVRTRVPHPPSTYFQRQCWVAAEPDEPMLGAVVAQIGAHRVLFGSDFPHTDHGEHALEAMLARRDELGDPVLREILWDNPCRVLGIDPGEHLPTD